MFNFHTVWVNWNGKFKLGTINKNNVYSGFILIVYKLIIYKCI